MIRRLLSALAEWLAPTMPDDLLALARATGVYIEDHDDQADEHTIPGGQPSVEWAMSAPLDPRHRRELDDKGLADFVIECLRSF